jgi:hypothetical protein
MARSAPSTCKAGPDEFAFRYNRRKTNGFGRIATHLLEHPVMAKPMSMRQLIDAPRLAACFRPRAARRQPDVR